MFPKLVGYMCLTLFFIALNMYVHCVLYIRVGRFGGLQIVAILSKKHCLENHVCPCLSTVFSVALILEHWYGGEKVIIRFGETQIKGSS